MRIRGISPIFKAECTVNNGKLFALVRASINENPLLMLAIWNRFNCTSSGHLYLIAQFNINYLQVGVWPIWRTWCPTGKNSLYFLCYENLLPSLSSIDIFSPNSKFESHLHLFHSTTLKVIFLLPTTVSFSGSKIRAVYATDRLQNMLCVIRRGSKMLLNCIGNDAQKAILSPEFSRIPFVQKLISKKSQFFSSWGK